MCISSSNGDEISCRAIILVSNNSHNTHTQLEEGFFMLRTAKKKGFTLIELLIVIVVIGVLTAGMMIAASEMEATAKAAQIINNLKQLETAAAQWYWNSYGTLSLGGNGYTFGGQNKTDGKVQKFSLHEQIKQDNTIIKRYLGNANFSLNEGNANWDQSTDSLYAKLGGYSVYVGNKNTELYVLYRLSNDSKLKDNARLRAKLKGKAKTANLVSYKDQEHNVYNGENVVGKLVMVFQ